MTNRNMVKTVRSEDAAKPNTGALPPMLAAEDSPTPTTREEPTDSPQPNESGQRAAPDRGHSGLATRRG